ncbi:Cell surface protein [Oopsacas minuta]|uniref:Cell surface protein n=1 Tax=Oopsacas minuta TaxID=111878 RepID=A0AAV7JVY2_9METZ|nr:Cell surface protein [Oopsacas minuta]
MTNLLERTEFEKSLRLQPTEPPQQRWFPRERSLLRDIPKIFHFIWVSPNLDTTNQSNLDVGILSNIQTCLDKHPDWAYRIWTDDMVRREYPVLSVQLLDYGIPAVISDVLRFNILASYGGIYMDTDFICFRSLEPLLEKQTCTAFAGSEDAYVDNEFNLVSVALIASIPGHFILERAASYAVNAARKSGKPNEKTGPFFLAKMIRKYNTTSECIYVINKKAFYDCNYEVREECDGRIEDYTNDNEIYAMHLWYASWHSYMN